MVAVVEDPQPRPAPVTEEDIVDVRRTRRQVALVVLGVLLLTTLAGCAAGPNPEIGTAGADGTVAGFWSGLWHGLIAPVTFVISLFTGEIGIYDVHNNGNWYNFGFVVGLGVLVGGGSGAGR